MKNLKKGRIFGRFFQKKICEEKKSEDIINQLKIKST